ncbi:MAG: T9SS type A sorting domain-containing protein [Ignavibacteria bacterium]|jgi:hypothetical protein|nr:T9SS type A sorting domain-containing protein [Ignavibacteria bacterium]
MIRGILYFTVMILSIYSLYASEDPLRDTLWIRQMPLGGQNFSKPLFHPNGKTVFATSDQYMFEYDVATGELLKTRETKSQLHINDYVLTSDTKHIIVGTLEDEATRRGYIEVWDIDTGFVKSLTLNKYDLVQRLAVSSDNKTLFVGTHSPSLYRINLATMLIEKEEDDYGFGDEIALSPDEKTLVVTTQYFQGGDMPWSVLLDSESFKVIGSIPDFISRPTFSSTGEYIVGGTYYQKKDYIALYNVRTGEYNRMGVNSTVLDAKFTKDNKYFIATTSSSGYLVYDIEQKKRLYTAPYETGGQYMALSPDNKYYCVAGVQSIVLWNFTNPIINSISDNSSSSLSIYPNPTQSSLTIQFPSSERNISYSIYDMHGQEIKSDNISDSEVHQGFITINTESQMSGMYIVRIRVGTEIYIRHYYIVR